MKLKLFTIFMIATGLWLAGCNDCNICEPISSCDPCAVGETASLDSSCGPACMNTWSNQAQAPCGSAIRLEKIVPEEVRNNCPFDYQIKVTNLTCDTLTNVVVTDQLPANMRFESVNPQVSSLEDGIAVWEIGTLEGKECLMIHATAIAEGDGCITSCAEVSYQNPVCAMMAIVESRLKLSKVAPECVMSCDRIPLCYVITNCGNASACNVRITDQLPAGLISCDGYQDICFEVGNLDCGESKEFQVMVDPTDLGTFGSIAVASSETCDTVESNYAATKVIKPVLAISQDGPSQQYICKDICYSVTVTNTSDCTAKDAMLTTQIPCHAYQKCSEGGTLVGDQIRWNVGDLAPGDSRTYSFVLTGQQPGVLETQSSASAYCADPVCAESQTTLTGVAALLMEVIDMCDPIEVGQNETYIITITNQGTAIATNIKLTSMIEDNMQFVSATGPTTGQAQGNMVQFAALSQLCPGEKAVWRVNVKAIDEGDTRFKSMMISDQLTRDVEETEATNVFMATPCGR